MKCFPASFEQMAAELKKDYDISDIKKQKIQNSRWILSDERKLKPNGDSQPFYWQIQSG